MKTYKIGDRNKDVKTNNSERTKNNKPMEAKVIPLQLSDEKTLGDTITVNSENEDVLTLVKDNKQDY